ncbi:MAG TPA: ATP-binding protein [Jatrophihabitans sp.]|jgi:serine/threonine-protein kinase RsbW
MSDAVVLTVPADTAYVSTVRLAAASLAARSDLTIDEVDDLRLAVDEACSLLLPHTTGGMLSVRFSIDPGDISVSVSVGADEATELDEGGIGWALLQALTTTVDVSHRDGQFSLTLGKRRQAAGQ